MVPSGIELDFLRVEDSPFIVVRGAFRDVVDLLFSGEDIYVSMFLQVHNVDGPIVSHCSYLVMDIKLL